MAFGIFKKKKEEEKVAEVRTGYLNLKVKEVVRETSDAISIHFEQPTTGDISYKSGQFFTLIAQVNGEEVRRAYSVCSSPYTDSLPAVAVKRVEGGKMSNYLNDELKAGQEMRVMEPNGNFTTDFDSGNDRHIVLFGGGSGITPLISIAKSALDQESNTKVSLIYANRNIESIIFKAKLEAMVAESNGRFQIVHVLEDNSGVLEAHTGRITKEIIETSLAQLPQYAANATEHFMCGPGPMMDTIAEALQALGVADSQVRRESFTSTASEKKEETASDSDEVVAREVTVLYDGDEYKYTVEPGETILEKGLEEDIDLPFSCQSGLCTACRGKCMSGKVKMDEEEGLSEAEIDEGYVLPCVSHPLTDDVVIEIG